MKKKFVHPEMKIVKLNSVEIIAQSGTGGHTGGGAWGIPYILPADFDPEEEEEE